MTRTIALYAAAIGVAAVVLEWIEYQYVARFFSTEIYVLLVALGFTALGVWVGWRLTARKPVAPFQRNEAALGSLGVTGREYEVLELLAAGHTNKEIARRLAVSPNTVKTHVGRLYEKLEVERRTQAIRKAKDLALIP